jgi:sugar/nucleoside kinase (ribokinase family)
MHDVTCLGILVADAVCRPVDEYPKRGQLVLVDRIAMYPGGCAANTGTALAKLGIATTIMGKVGADPFGDFVINALGARGLDTGSIVRDPDAQTSATAVMVQSDGERSFVHCVGANAKLREAELDFATIEASRILHIAGTFLMPGFDGQATASVLKRAREAGVTTCLDTAWDSRGNWMKLLECCLPHLDYCVPSYEEAQKITGKTAPEDIAQVLMDHGVGTVGIKMGEDGCYLRSPAESVRMPACRVEAVDATGAGDAFVAGFLTGVVNAWDLEATARFANAVGASCVTAIGTSDGIRTFDETMALADTLKAV